MISPEGDTDLDLSESAHTAQSKQKPAPKVDSKAEIEQMELEAIIKAKNEFLDKLKSDKTLLEFYNHPEHIKNYMPHYKDDFGTDPMQDGFVKVVANMINRKQEETAS